MIQTNHSNFDQIYSCMIAGTIPRHSGDIDKTVFMMARDVLGTAQFHLIVASDAASETVYYLAAPSAAFASAPVFATPLATALPTHPQHQGDGIYLLQELDHLSVAIEKKQTQIRIFSSSAEQMSEWLQVRSDLPVYRVEGYQAWAMEAVPSAYRRLADGISLKTARISAFVASLALLLYLVASIGMSVAKASADRSNQTHISAINDAISKIDFVSPLAQQVARVQKISALVVRAGGWIDEYEIKNGEERFVLMMPSWITKDYIDALGPKVEADQSNDENLVRISLGAPLPGTTPVRRDWSAKPMANAPASSSIAAPVQPLAKDAK